ncbi:MAG: metallophosphoesterase, partial [Candidatus Aenigmarchaeota archaeon]|nr:metallophosphoesterase [Candidatus Aenigmarchaeota archaeon]
MRIAVIADIHNDTEMMMQSLDKLKELGFDAIVCPGDFTDIAPRGFTQEDVGRLLIEELKSEGKPVICVPGNMDLVIIPLLEKGGISVHGLGKTVGEIGFYGFGGAKTPFGTAYEPDEAEIEAGLRKAYDAVKDAKYKIHVTHNPPFGTKADMLPSGMHVGSKTVRRLIEELKPVAAVCAHIHEGRGVDELGCTKIINPGRLPEGYCGILEVKDGTVTAEIVGLI